MHNLDGILYVCVVHYDEHRGLMNISSQFPHTYTCKLHVNEQVPILTTTIWNPGKTRHLKAF